MADAADAAAAGAGGGLTFVMDDGGGKRAAKRPKLLGEDVVWKPAGENVNLVEVGGKSCTHEVGGARWGGGGRRGRPPRQGRAGGGLPAQAKGGDGRRVCRAPPTPLRSALRNRTRQVLWPPEPEGAPPVERSRLPPPKHAGEPARTYPFALDPFQQTAINCLEAGGWRAAVWAG
jgi:hypothetical protein